MKNQPNQKYISQVGDKLWSIVKTASFSGLFLSLTATSFVWAGTEDLPASPLVWKISLVMSFVCFIATWITYIPFRKTDRLLGAGLLGIFAFLTLFWLFGFSGFYFYFLFAQINDWFRAVALFGMTAALIYRSWIIFNDTKRVFASNKALLSRMYVDEGSTFGFNGEVFIILEKTMPERNPFKTWYVWIVMLIAPFTLVLNRLLTPIFGSGHGVFLVLAFLVVPLLLWGAGFFVQFVILTIYYPIKLERETGKPVLMKDW